MTVYIYVLEDPNTNQVCYVGQTVSPEIRLNTHKQVSKRDMNRKLSAWIRRLLNNDQEPVMHIIETVEDAQAREREQYWLDKFRAEGLKLMNSRGVIDEWADEQPKETRPQFLLRFPSDAEKQAAEEWAARLGYGSLTEYILSAIEAFDRQWSEKRYDDYE